MAKLKSLIKIEGTLDDLTFYKGRDGYIVKSKGGISANRIKNDPSFARTRENGMEFGNSATSGKDLRRAIPQLLADAKDDRLTSRLTQTMSKIKNDDLTSPRGYRNVATGIQTAQGKSWLIGFDYNVDATLESVLLLDFAVNPVTGTIVLEDFNPLVNLRSPESATHVTFTSAFLILDFETGDKSLEMSPPDNIPINGVTSTITLTPAAVPTGTGTSMYFLKLAFYQEVNGIQYPLKNGTYNALQSVEVV